MSQCHCGKGTGVCRCVGATVSAIYNVIAGLFFIFTGLGMVMFWGPVLDLLNRVITGGIAFFIPGLPAAIPGTLPFGSVGINFPSILPQLTFPFILLGIVLMLFGIASLIAAYGLICLRNWARIMAIVLHGATALIALIWFVLLAATGWIGASLPFLFLSIISIAMVVVLMLPSTVRCFVAVASCCGHKPVAPCPPAPCPAPAACPPHPVCSPCPQPAHCHQHGTAHYPYVAAPATSAHITPVPAAVPMTQVVGAGAPAVAQTEILGPPPLMAWLIELTGTRSGRQYPLKQQVVVGRNPNCCDLVLDDGKVSGTHARVRFEQGQFVLYDLASTNHTYVNGQEVMKYPLQDGDRIKLGPNATLAFVRVSP